MVDRDLRRAFALIVPYWRRLALVMALSLASTAVSLYLPLLSRDVFDGALLGHDAGRLEDDCNPTGIVRGGGLAKAG